jgi:hypothetical protein
MYSTQKAAAIALKINVKTLNGIMHGRSKPSKVNSEKIEKHAQELCVYAERTTKDDNKI